MLGAPALAATRDARACGGCFHQPSPQEKESVVTDHRMVFALSTTQTVLWDQIRYSGNPAEFAWVLPIHPGARVELSSDAWLAALEASTDVVVTGPAVDCPGAARSSGGGGVGCGASSAVSSGSFAGGGADNYDGGNGVQVVSQSVVGPYDTVTVRSSQGDALQTWLTSNGFDVPPSIEPTLAAYAQEGFDFIALKLRPGEGIRAMQPVRVVTPGADPSLPLRMVAAGAGAQVGLTLYVVSEGRYRVQNFPNVAIDAQKLTWDPHNNRSNYAGLAEQAMTSGDGRGWLTESAAQADLGYYGTGYGPNLALGATYRALCAAPPPSFVPCDAGSSADADADAAEAAVPSCPATPPACDDLEVATKGLHFRDIWVTRLRAHLPSQALAVGDLRLEADPTQAPVSNQLHTDRYSDPSFNPCAQNGASASDSGCACSAANDDRAVGSWVIGAATALAVSAMTRRMRRRTRRA